MDFVERIFRISPDHGSGVTEIAMIIILLAAPLLIAALKSWRRLLGDPQIPS